MTRKKKDNGNPYTKRSVDTVYKSFLPVYRDNEENEHLVPLLDDQFLNNQSESPPANEKPAQKKPNANIEKSDKRSLIQESFEEPHISTIRISEGHDDRRPLLDSHRRRWMRDACRETRIIAKYAIPCISTLILLYLNKLITVVVVGQMGAKELAASSLAVMYINVFGYSVLTGLSTATETLCSNAVTGATSMKEAGLHLQRGIWIGLAFSVPLGIIWLFSEPLLLFAGQDPELCRMVSLYIKYSLIALPSNSIFTNLVRFLQAQGYMLANLYVLILGMPLNLGMQYLLVYYPPTRIGFFGAPLAAAINDWIVLLLLVIYTCYINGYQAWNGWTLDAFNFNGWMQYFQYGVPGTLMVCAEWWSFELMALVAGWYGQLELATQSIILSTGSMTYMVYNGISIANANRIGNLLGAMAPARAKESALVSLAMAFVCACLIGLTLLLTRHCLSYIFTQDSAVAVCVAQVLPIAAFMQIFDSLSCVGGGVLRGSGRQRLGAIINLIAYYLIALPLSILVYYKTDFRLSGMWFSLTFALAISGILVTIAILRTDWEAECIKARARVRTRSTSALDDIEYLTTHPRSSSSSSRAASALEGRMSGVPVAADAVDSWEPSMPSGQHTSSEYDGSDNNSTETDDLDPKELLRGDSSRTVPVGSFFQS